MGWGPVELLEGLYGGGYSNLPDFFQRRLLLGNSAESSDRGKSVSVGGRIYPPSRRAFASLNKRGPLSRGLAGRSVAGFQRVSAVPSWGTAFRPDPAGSSVAHVADSPPSAAGERPNVAEVQIRVPCRKVWWFVLPEEHPNGALRQSGALTEPERWRQRGA